MDAQTIEKQDALRYRLILVRAIGFFLMIGGLLLVPTAAGWSNKYILVAIIGIGTLIFLYGIIRLIAWMRKVNRQPELKKALNNEVYVTYECRSMAGGFGIFIAASLFFGSSIGENIPTQTACYAILFCGVTAYHIAQLIFHRK